MEGVRPSNEGWFKYMECVRPSNAVGLNTWRV